MTTEPVVETALALGRGGQRFLVERYRRTRYWQVLDPSGELVCLTVYKRGALEVVRRLNA